MATKYLKSVQCYYSSGTSKLRAKWNTTIYPPWLKRKKLAIPNIGKNMVQLIFSNTLCKSVNWNNHFWKTAWQCLVSWAYVSLCYSNSTPTEKCTQNATKDM